MSDSFNYYYYTYMFIYDLDKMLLLLDNYQQFNEDKGELHQS